MFHTLVTFYHSIPASTWQVIGAAIGLSGLLQAVKHWFFKELSAQATMTLTGLFAFLASAIQYGESAVKGNPTILGQHTALLVGVMTFAYRFIVSPGYNLLVDAKTYRAGTPAVTTPSVGTVVTLDTTAAPSATGAEASF